VGDNYDRPLPLQRVDAVLNVVRCEWNEQVPLGRSDAVSRSLRRLIEQQQVRLLEQLARCERSDRVFSECAVSGTSK
jgi:hypothetical protein